MTAERPETWQTRAQLLKAARAASFKLSDSQLGRLHRAGLVPSPRTRALGRGKGTISEFPPGSTQRLLRVLEVQSQKPRQKLAAIAWRLWWEDGGPAPAPARELLADVATRWDRDREQLADLLRREDLGDADAEREANAFYKSSEHDRVDGPVGAVRRNTGREGFSSVARVFAEVATGRFDSYQDHEEIGEDGAPRPGTTGALVERALGLDHARSDRIAGRGPRFSGSSEAQLMLLSELIGERQLQPLASRTPDGELDEVRGEVRNLLALISTFAPMVERTLGGDASGYRTIGRALNLRTPGLQATMVLAWLALRGETELLDGMRGLIARLPQALAAAELERLAHELSKEAPALEAAFANAARANLRGDAEQSEHWRAEIKRISDEHREQVDGFFARHPEVTALIESAHGGE